MKPSVAIIAGASQGIGRATALRLAKDFSGIVLGARNAEALNQVAVLVRQAGAEPLPLPLDLREPAAAKSLVEGTLKQFGRIDALVNISGAAPQVDLLEMTDGQRDPDGWRRNQGSLAPGPHSGNETTSSLTAKIMQTTKSQLEEFDIVILGSGQAGSFIAWTMAGKGKRVVVIERKWVGGACPNVACMPSKNIIHSAKIASYFYRSEEFGIHKENTRIDMAGVRDHKRKMVAEMWNLALEAYKNSGAELVMGVGRMTGDRTVEVELAGGGKRIFHGKDVIINTGSRALIEPISGLVEAGPLTHIEALDLDHVPGHLLILGGGYIGLELAQAMRRFGGEVTIIDRNGRLAHREDQDISEALQQLCQDEGINVVSDFTATLVKGKSGERVRIIGKRRGTEVSLEGTEILAASGRTPNTNNLGLESAGVALTERGHVKVNERLQTTAPGVWAVGDCAGSPYFTHISHDDFRVVCDNLTGGDRKTTGRQVPFCLFTDPEFARVGLSETEAKERGISYRLAKIPMAAVIRAHTLSETRGFMKALIETEGDRILGFAAFGVDVGEIMPAVQVAMLAGLPYTLLRDAVIAHPTVAEGLEPLFSSVPQRS